ncbi:MULTISPECIES: antifreeze protein [Brucella/Ochrobactrum group]|uniref:antifreeze protein n=1 Tax=Brucella/Ochrobactrum group TaxID=2826938 RepID=UPI001655CC06|nr:MULTISPECIES: antifreeze protein [Brucella/Ochrobactrum group]MBC8717802.1 antifreeze protein [Ochrobactrum sp. Marseille-Q0166]
MSIRTITAMAGTAIILGASAFAFSSPANALTMKECSTKYQAAKDAGTLGDVKWNDFRKTQCGDDAAAAPVAAPATKAAAPAKKAAASNDDSAKGLTMKQCSAKYQAAKDAGTDGGAKWNDFRKAECGPGADAVALSTDGNSEPAAPTTAAPKGVKFPSAVSAKFSSESPGKARMHTCLEQYHAAKDANALGGLKWVQKGGGYYSLCNARLKGNS